MKALVILGMHRSGTSLVAQACAAAGISAGPRAELLSAQSDNPEGFYENRHLVELNDRLLESIGSSWFSPPDEPLRQCPGALQEEQTQLLNRLSEAGIGEFFIKDPRLCLTLPAWLSACPDATLLYVYRSPLPVARSLAKRNDFSLQLGLQLWEIYNRRAIHALSDQRCASISYDDLAMGVVNLEQLLSLLHGYGFECSPAAAASVFSPSLRHFNSDDSDADLQLLTDSQRALHLHCQALCRGETPSMPLLDSIPLIAARARDSAAALAPLARTVETANERDEALASLEERTRERDTALSALRALEGEHSALAAAHDSEKQLHKKAEVTLSDLSEQHSALAARHDALVEDHARLNDLHTRLHDQHADLGARHSELEEKADYLFFELTESYRKLLAFEQSTMARLQRYLRSGYRLITGQRGRNSAYEDLLGRAHAHFDEFAIDKPGPEPNKLRMAGDVLRYVWQNPAGSARSFSFARLRRAVSVFFGSSSPDLAVWVNARFPESDPGLRTFDPKALSAELDTLELSFPEVDDPVVSIIVPVYNDYRVTMNCLRSVQRHQGNTRFEVILADDCSTDLTATIGERVRGITVSRTDQNQRFLRNCNQAAKRARGQFLLFLNNDTEVTGGWLDALMRPFADPDVGVCGPKLLFADGRLQEAGGIIWRDASGWNFGRADDPGKPAYSYLRDVDYVSGAALVIRNSLWSELGGFDERFAPAYYEDADICFAAREAGYRVVYQPHSVVYHFEGVSNGTDLDSGVKQHQVRNQSVFRDKWASELDAHHFANAEHVIHARDRSAAKPCVLVIDHYVPHYDKDAGGRSTQMYIELLLRLGCRVQFMGANFFPHKPYTQELEAMGVEVLVGESIARHLDAWFEEHAPYITEIFLHRPHVAEQFLPQLERLDDCPPVSFFGHDLHYLRTAREAALSNDEDLRRESEQWRRRELAVFERVDRVYYFSDAELDEICGSVPAAKLRRVPLYAMPALPPREFAPTHPRELLFVGGYNHPPNVDAATWLATEILPALREREPEAALHLVGSNPPEAVHALSGPGVTVHGYLSDKALDALYRRVGASVVPLRYGAGVKGKVIEAICQNVPLVTTDIGAEGIPDAESVMWVGNSTDAIVEALLEILGRGDAVTKRMHAYGDWLETHFSLERAIDHLAEDRPWIRPDSPERASRAWRR